MNLSKLFAFFGGYGSGPEQITKSKKSIFDPKFPTQNTEAV